MPPNHMGGPPACTGSGAIGWLTLSVLPMNSPLPDHSARTAPTMSSMRSPADLSSMPKRAMSGGWPNATPRVNRPFVIWSSTAVS
ncbi:hypothetical protein D3C80_2011040 [compost metagenome]